MNLPRWLDILIPRFVSEETAVQNQLCGHCEIEHPQPVCAMSDIEPGEVYDGIVTVRFFNFFGEALFPRLAGPIRPWVNPHDKVRP